MPTYLDFNTTKSFRDFILGKTLSVPNGPQTFNNTNYRLQNLSDMADLNTGTVDDTTPSELLQSQSINIYKPLQYFVKDSFTSLPRRGKFKFISVFSNRSRLYFS